MKTTSLLLALAATSLSVASAHAATSWDLAGDYLEATNPNGAWTYGAVSGATFSALAWNAGTSSYGAGLPGQPFIYKRTAAGTDFGIASGKVSLEADWANPSVRWTAPAAGIYAFTIAVGGSTASGPGGYGNNFASAAGVRLDGVDRAADSFVGNIKTWSFTTTLAAGSTVDTFVINPGFANGGNTQTDVWVTEVPEPGSALLLSLGIGALALGRQRRQPA